ncbi:hypothetical protein Glo7428_3880 [Gloeocapsa sp. PCC 7428]|uniref:hypothetical protein n=1 Tax=Gloeocapsa sp. PCC 7428 TaxID=1173026 RepID=UPI0002A61142|nr:hypothetical protein [Gloeocapsa sp. PCC 7428]AFZ32336.1 hypothetical protein Glo7428_3880 [Gloeocapsa sp. PCC 7428]
MIKVESAIATVNMSIDLSKETFYVLKAIGIDALLVLRQLKTEPATINTYASEYLISNDL